MRGATKTSLANQEWMVIGGLLILIFSLFVSSKIQAKRVEWALLEHPLPSHEKCSVEIRGAVAKPGVFSVLPGTELRKILKKSILSPFADLRNIDPSSRVESSCCIEILELEEIQIAIQENSGERTEIFLPRGSKISDVHKFLPEPLKKYRFRGRRTLKNGEILTPLEEKLAKKSQVLITSPTDINKFVR